MIFFVVMIVVSVMLLTIGYSVFFSIDSTLLKREKSMLKVVLFVSTVGLGSITFSMAVIGLIFKVVLSALGYN